jgi:hypothetical protein
MLLVIAQPYRLPPDPVDAIPQLLEKHAGTGKAGDANLMR